MKYLFSSFLLASMYAVSAQSYNFYGTEFYLSPDDGAEPGTVLTASGENLSAFDYTWASPAHPIFTQGIYFPAQDCGDRNLWVRVQHVAHDPNGIENGFAIGQTLNSPFLPLGSTDRIGGWAGFLYDIQIFADASLSGERQNILNGTFPTNITVESLETLYNNGAELYEWLSFVIINDGSTGWSLNSIDFTGINPYSNPGFSAELNYSTTATPNTPPTGFSTDFPGGSDSIYAVDLNLSAAYHSEFRMSAGGVSHFQYGYEFTTGGYQGMSMSFGAGPMVNSLLTNPVCNGESTGSIALEVTGYEPITYNWSNGDSDALNDALEAGEYSVSVTDALGCSVDFIYNLSDPSVLSGYLDLGEGEEGWIINSFVEGGSGDYTYLWNTGSTESIILPDQPGDYTLTVTDSYGCSIVLEQEILAIRDVSNSVLRFYPNPVGEVLTIIPSGEPVLFELFDIPGNRVKSEYLAGSAALYLDLSDLAPGMYIVRVGSQSQTLLKR